MDNIEDYKRALKIQKKARAVAEQQLEVKSRELFEKNESLKAALKKLNSQQQRLIAQEKVASIGHLAAGLAHEINNPNAFIVSNMATLMEYVEHLRTSIAGYKNILGQCELTDPAVGNAVREIDQKYDVDYISSDAVSLIREVEQGALRIKRITEGLSYFRHQNTDQIRSFDINTCVEKSIELLKMEQGVTCEISKQLNEMPVCESVPSLLVQAITNVLRNAVQSTPKSDNIMVSTYEKPNQVCVKIEDDGCGIEQDALNRVFDPFYTTKPPQTGLGLTISQAIVKRLNGEISLNSELGRGSSVQICLPL